MNAPEACLLASPLFSIVEVGALVDVFHESGDLEGWGVVVAFFGPTEGQAGWVVRLTDERVLFRPEARLAARTWEG